MMIWVMNISRATSQNGDVILMPDILNGIKIGKPLHINWSTWYQGTLIRANK